MNAHQRRKARRSQERLERQATGRKLSHEERLSIKQALRNERELQVRVRDGDHRADDLRQYFRERG
jgi:hypothetical protein